MPGSWIGAPSLELGCNWKWGALQFRRDTSSRVEGGTYENVLIREIV